ncbi:MAG: hypothetical protein E6X17_08880, partial [Sporomusaceae bacterium]|nr:hypothetical protein [Sporomusaceae bacterium]
MGANRWPKAWLLSFMLHLLLLGAIGWLTMDIVRSEQIIELDLAAFGGGGGGGGAGTGGGGGGGGTEAAGNGDGGIAAAATVPA